MDNRSLLYTYTVLLGLGGAVFLPRDRRIGYNRGTTEGAKHGIRSWERLAVAMRVFSSPGISPRQC